MPASWSAAATWLGLRDCKSAVGGAFVAIVLPPRRGGMRERSAAMADLSKTASRPGPGGSRIGTLASAAQSRIACTSAEVRAVSGAHATVSQNREGKCERTCEAECVAGAHIYLQLVSRFVQDDIASGDQTRSVIAAIAGIHAAQRCVAHAVARQGMDEAAHQEAAFSLRCECSPCNHGTACPCQRCRHICNTVRGNATSRHITRREEHHSETGSNKLVWRQLRC